MSDDLICSALFVVSGIVFVATGIKPAPYGRYVRPGFGPGLPPRLAWFSMAAPGLGLFGYVIWEAPALGQVVPSILIGFWLAHFAHRCLVHPLQIRSRVRVPLAVVALGVLVCSALAYVNAHAVGGWGREYPVRWLWSVRFLYGTLVFGTGFVVNRYADWKLCRLRTESGQDRALPRGGVFDELACPNYLGEMMMWIGWAILTWSKAGFAMAAISVATLVPRGYSHLLWYRRTFREYPPSRRAVIPFLL